MIDFFTEDDIQHLIDYIRGEMNPEKPLLIFIDLFCGCGGVTDGFIDADENFFVAACVNHDEFAIKSHHANHPFCIHYTEDIRDFNLIEKLCYLIKRIREAFPGVVIGVHGSLECTHFSKAKGGLPRDGDSRTLGYHLINYAAFKPDYFTIENVEEFRTWGPMAQVKKDGLWKASYKKITKKVFWLEESFEQNPAYYEAKGLTPWEMPIKERQGEDYDAWKKSFEDIGYRYDYRILNAADFGAPTSRKRYFGIFSANGFPICFPEQTHVSRKKAHLRPDLKIHNPVRDVLDLDNEGVSLFGLNKNGVEYVKATFERVYFGLIKSWKEGWFTVRYNGGNPRDKNKSIDEPLGTILTNNTHGLVRPIFLSTYYGGSNYGQGIHQLEDASPVITTKDRISLHHLQYAYGKAKYDSIEGIVGPRAQHLTYDYTNGGKGNHSSLDEPAHAITTNPKHKLVTAKWLFDTQYDRVAMSLDKPSPTIIARQDKKPIYLASAGNSGDADNSVWQEDDIFIKMLLRTFMRQHGITDVKIRSLELHELLKAQGFKEDYILKGGKTRSMRYIGNSVSPPMAKANGKAIYGGILKHLTSAYNGYCMNSSRK